MEDREKIVYNILDQLEIEYEIFRHAPVMTIEAAKEVDEQIGFPICKNLFLSARHGAEYFLLLMPGVKKFQTGQVSKQLGVPRMTFAGEGPMLAYLNLLPGSVSPMGLLHDKENQVRFLIDKDLVKQEKVAVHPCVNTATVVLKMEDLLKKVMPFCGHSVTEVVL